MNCFACPRNIPTSLHCLQTQNVHPISSTKLKKSGSNCTHVKSSIRVLNIDLIQLPLLAGGIAESNKGSGNDATDGVNEAVEVRNYFPETWLWNLEVVGDEGYTDKEADIPHTITEWVGSMFCTSDTAGLGVSPPSTIKAFQPFFVSYSLPYSVVRKEKVPIIVSVFNYLPDCLPVSMSLESFVHILKILPTKSSPKEVKH